MGRYSGSNGRAGGVRAWSEPQWVQAWPLPDQLGREGAKLGTDLRQLGPLRAGLEGAHGVNDRPVIVLQQVPQRLPFSRGLARLL